MCMCMCVAVICVYEYVKDELKMHKECTGELILVSLLLSS